MYSEYRLNNLQIYTLLFYYLIGHGVRLLSSIPQEILSSYFIKIHLIETYFKERLEVIISLIYILRRMAISAKWVIKGKVFPLQAQCDPEGG